MTFDFRNWSLMGGAPDVVRRPKKPWFEPLEGRESEPEIESDEQARDLREDGRYILFRDHPTQIDALNQSAGRPADPSRTAVTVNGAPVVPDMSIPRGMMLISAFSWEDLDRSDLGEKPGVLPDQWMEFFQGLLTNTVFNEAKNRAYNRAMSVVRHVVNPDDYADWLATLVRP